MSEKRHWLYRQSSKVGGAYNTNMNRLPPKRRGVGWVTSDGSHWEYGEHDILPGPDGLVYGHKLEPGGGPVDISQWFPEGGKQCGNCGWSCQVTNLNCKYALADTCHYATGRGHWKPRKKEPMVTDFYRDGRVVTHPLADTQPSIPGAEEGGRKMQTFKVVVKEYPPVKEIEAGADVELVHVQDDILAKDMTTAVFLAGREMMKTRPEQKIRQSLLEITVVPFGK